MDVDVLTESETTALKLTGEASVADAERLRDALMTAVTSVGPVAVDASGIERWDAATAQLVLAARNTCRAQSRAFEVRGPSPAAAATWRLLGLPDDVIAQGGAAHG